MPEHARRVVFLHTSAYVSIRQHTSAYVHGCLDAGARTPRGLPAYVSIQQHTSRMPGRRSTQAAWSSCIRQHTSAYVTDARMPDARRVVFLHTSAYVSIRQHTSAYVSIRVSIRQLTSAYVSIHTPAARPKRRRHWMGARPPRRLVSSCAVSIRQHTSEYVSIRQHTSAYVSIRQHAYARSEATEATYERVCCRTAKLVVLKYYKPLKLVILKYWKTLEAEGLE
jgi:hypothetical protein